MPDLDSLYDDVIRDDSPLEELDDDINPNAPDFEDEDFDSEAHTFQVPDIGYAGHGEDPDEEDPDEAEPQTQHNEGPYDSIEENEVINDLLAAKGITDPKSINYENDEGQLEQVNFYDLPYEEQMNILRSTDDVNTLLDDDEIETVNFLRRNGVSLEDTIKYYERKAVEDYINSQNISGLEIDQYTDEELYVMHLRTEYGELTNDEVDADLQKQLEHPDLFKKKVDKLRTEFKEIEAKQLEETRFQQEQQDEQKFEELKNNLVSVAESIDDVGGSGLDLDIDEKNEILHYILEKDINGVSPFIKSLNSPKQLFELAWFAVKGQEAFNVVHDYYKKEIDKVRKTSYEKGKQSVTGTPAPAAAPKEQNNGRKTVVRKAGFSPKPTGTTPTGVGSINDLYNNI